MAHEAKLHQLGRGSNIFLLPPVPYGELLKWVQGASLGAILYEPANENQLLCSPNKIWEYASSGVPVIATDLPFLGEKVAKEGIGWTVGKDEEPHEIASLVNSLNRRRLAQRGRKGLLLAKRENWAVEVQRLATRLKGA